MIHLRNVTMATVLTFTLIWMSGCGGCNPAPIPSGMSPTEGPETGGTTVRITGEKFDMKNGVSVTIGGKSAQNVTVPSETEITAVTPAGTAGESVAVVVTNKKKAEEPATLSQQFTYTDATAPTVTSVEPADGALISDYEDSLNVRNSISFTFSEDVDSMSGTVSVMVESTPESISQESGAVPGSVSGTGNMVTFTSDEPMRSGRKYTVTVADFKDAKGNALASSFTSSFSVSYPEKVRKYQVREGETLPMISARPEVYDDANLWPRLVEANQDDFDLNPRRLKPGLMLWVPDRGPAWGD